MCLFVALVFFSVLNAQQPMCMHLELPWVESRARQRRICLISLVFVLFITKFLFLFLYVLPTCITWKMCTVQCARVSGRKILLFSFLFFSIHSHSHSSWLINASLPSLSFYFIIIFCSLCWSHRQELYDVRVYKAWENVSFSEASQVRSICFCFCFNTQTQTHTTTFKYTAIRVGYNSKQFISLRRFKSKQMTPFVCERNGTEKRFTRNLCAT